MMKNVKNKKRRTSVNVPSLRKKEIALYKTLRSKSDSVFGEVRFGFVSSYNLIGGKT